MYLLFVDSLFEVCISGRFAVYVEKSSSLMIFDGWTIGNHDSVKIWKFQ